MTMEESPFTDAELLQRHLDGDRDAFSLLRARYAGLVYGACRRVTGDPTLAEDAAQGVFLVLNERAKKLAGHSSLAGWLLQTSRFVSKNLLREERRRQFRERKAFSPPEHEADWSEVEGVIDEAMCKLGQADREAILLRFAQGQSFAAMGLAANVSENTARMRVNRAVERLRKVLRGMGMTVASLALMTMLSTRMAEAAPLTVADGGHPSLRAQGLVRGTLRHLRLTKALPFGFAGLAGIAVFGFFAASSRPDPASPQQIARAFSQAQGDWKGNLEYADDATGERFRYPATVHIEAQGNRLRITARYQGTPVVDETEIRPFEGGYRFENRGSHALDGEYVAQALPDGTLRFDGRSPFLKASVRLTFQTGTGSLTIAEDYRRSFDLDYRFRNRFTLRR